MTHMRGPITGCSKEAHSPVQQPRHREVAREVLWWQARCPRIPVLLAKRDVKAAFELIWRRVEDVGLTTIELLGSWLSTRATPSPDVCALFLSMNFGWNGVPGVWMAWGWAPKPYTNAHKPGDAHCTETRSATILYVLIDDGVLVEPCLGVRPWAASATFEEGLRIILGWDALNV